MSELRVNRDELNIAAEKYVKRHYYKNAWEIEKRTFIAGAKWVLKFSDKQKVAK